MIESGESADSPFSGLHWTVLGIIILRLFFRFSLLITSMDWYLIRVLQDRQDHLLNVISLFRINYCCWAFLVLFCLDESLVAI